MAEAADLEIVVNLDEVQSIIASELEDWFAPGFWSGPGCAEADSAMVARLLRKAIASLPSPKSIGP
jgi:hypothetical protein